MFSGNELRRIRGWAQAHISILQADLKGDMFTAEEKSTKQRELALCACVKHEAESLLDSYIAVDADHAIHLLSLCEQRVEHLREQVQRAELGMTDYAAEMYQIGYMQGRLEMGLVRQEDLAVLMEWEYGLE